MEALAHHFAEIVSVPALRFALAAFVLMGLAAAAISWSDQ